MSAKVRQMSFEDRVCEKAEELAEQRHSMEFNDLPNHLQMSVWMEAEQLVKDQLADEGDHLRDGRHEYWAELELMRRLGK